MPAVKTTCGIISRAGYSVSARAAAMFVFIPLDCGHCVVFKDTEMQLFYKVTIN